MATRQSILVFCADEAKRRDLSAVLGESFAFVFMSVPGEVNTALADDAGKYACLFADISEISEKDGVKVISYYAEKELSRELPLIALNDGNTEREVFALSRGAVECINLPADARSLLLRVQNAIKNSAVFKLEEQNNELKYAAEHDRLTGIYNRPAFYAAANALIAENRDVEYMAGRFDIEKFKLINDMFGHDEGDRVLCIVAANLEKFVGRYGGVCGRIEADVFAFCLPHGEETVRGLQKWVDTNIEQININFEIVMPFGIYVVDDRRLTADIMLDRATLAQKTVKGVYATKFAFYDDKMRAALVEEQEIVGQMKSSLEGGEFQIYLQPQCRLDSGTIIGAEALLRWTHPTLGKISPGVFVPIFEKNGFIMELDAYVWESVCKILRGWLDRDMVPLPVSVNISRVNVYNTNICKVLNDLVDKYNIPKPLLKLEITESAYTDNAAGLIEIITELRQNGFTILMDDFGSGYSSLNMLKDMPVDILKVDLQFLYGTDEEGRGGNILASVVRMARWLNMPVIAEGVETSEQARFLRSIGCNNAQGYLFFKPMPVADYEKAIKTAPVNATAFDAYRKAFDMDKLMGVDNDFSVIFDSVIGGAAIFDVSGDNAEAIRVNREYLNIIKYSMDEFYQKGMRIFDGITAEDDRAKVKAAFETARRTGSPSECEYRKINGDGENIWVYSKMRFLAGDENHAMYYISISDITARRETETQLYYTEERFRTLFESTRMSMWDYDYKTKRILQTGHSQDMHGFGSIIENVPESLIESGFVHPDSVDAYRKMHAKMTAGAKTVEGVFRVQTTDRKGYWYEHISYTNVFDEKGKPYRAIGLSNDVTERHKKDEKYREELEYLRSHTDEYYCSYAQNVTRGRVEEIYSANDKEREITLNATFEKFLTLAADRVVANDDVVELYSGLSQKKIRKMYDQGETELKFEYQRKCLQTGVLWVETVIHIVEEADGDDIIAFVYIRDINERKLAEIEEKQAEKLDPITGLYNKEDATEAIEHYLAGMLDDERAALIIIDIDNLKLINEESGKLRGDEVLVDFAEKLKRVFKESAIIGRYGGDEFIILQKNGTKSLVEGRLNELYRAISVPTMSGIKIKITVGVSYTGESSYSYRMLLAHGDKALQRGKIANKNAVKTVRTPKAVEPVEEEEAASPTKKAKTIKKKKAVKSANAKEPKPKKKPTAKKKPAANKKEKANKE